MYYLLYISEELPSKIFKAKDLKVKKGQSIMKLRKVKKGQTPADLRLKSFREAN
jgi:hypothetical protein